MLCRKQQELIENVQRHLQRIAELARAESAAMENKAENTWMEIDRQIELEIGEKERALGALRQHRQEHGC